MVNKLGGWLSRGWVILGGGCAWGCRAPTCCNAAHQRRHWWYVNGGIYTYKHTNTHTHTNVHPHGATCVLIANSLPINYWIAYKRHECIFAHGHKIASERSRRILMFAIARRCMNAHNCVTATRVDVEVRMCFSPVSSYFLYTTVCVFCIHHIHGKRYRFAGEPRPRFPIKVNAGEFSSILLHASIYDCIWAIICM